MAPDTEGAKEGTNIEQKDVAELMSKLDAKHNVKVATQGKGQKSNHSLISSSEDVAVNAVCQHADDGS